MRRVLLIAYLFPPVANSGTRRSLAFANHLPDHGWQPLVLAWEPDARTAQEPEMMDELRSSLRVERVPLVSRLQARRIAAWLPKRIRSRAEDALAWRLRSRALIPDESGGWLKPAVERALQLHATEGFDAIYASGFPWTSFLVAREVSRRTGKPYVLDYRDQWKPSGDMAWERSSPQQQKENPALERLAARDAAAVITVTRALVRSIGRDCGRDDLHLITNGFEPADFAQPVEKPADGLLRVVYTGVWRDGYGLQDLYAAIGLLQQQGHPELARLRVEAAGFPVGRAREAGVAPWVVEHGRVSHRAAVTLMKQADLLYLPVPSGYYAVASLPGKLFEYLGCGRPILAVVPQCSEVADTLVSTGGALRVDPGDFVGLAALLLARLRSQEALPLPQGLQRYTRDATSRQLAQVLDAAVEQRHMEPLK